MCVIFKKRKITVLSFQFYTRNIVGEDSLKCHVDLFYLNFLFYDSRS